MADERQRLKLALRLAKLGLYIAPLLPGSKAPYSGESWSNMKSRDEDVITGWFRDRPGMNYAVTPGDEFVIIDLDVKPAKGEPGKPGYRPAKDGITDLDEIAAMDGDYSSHMATLTVRTPSGGYHRYFRAPFPVANAHTLPKSIDVRGTGGYVVGPGCHTDHNPVDNTFEGDYEVTLAHDIMPLPEYLHSRIQHWVPPSRRPSYEDSVTVVDGKAFVDGVQLDEPVMVGRAKEWLERAKPAVEGQNGNATTFATFAWLREHGISMDMAFQLVREVYNPRCQPEWSVEELAQLCENAYKYARRAVSDAGAVMDKGKSEDEIVSESTDVASLLANLEAESTAAATRMKADELVERRKTDDDLDSHTWKGNQVFDRPAEKEFVIPRVLPAAGYVGFLARRGTGKGLKNGEPVQTLYGEKAIEDVKVGDILAHPDGGFTTVTGVFPQGVRPCYEFEFEDGSVARCDDSHLWRLHITQKNTGTGGRDKVLPMSEVLRLFETHRLSIPTIDGALARRGRSVRPKLDAYLLGLLLGDGSFGPAQKPTVGYTTTDKELEAYLRKRGFRGSASAPRAPGHLPITHLRLTNPRRNIGDPVLPRSQLYAQLRDLGLFGKTAENKFIPPMFFAADGVTRLALLQGLMDTDGTPSGSGAEFSSASEQLAKGVQRLAWSLGARASINRGESWLNGERHLDRYRVFIQPGNKFKPFRLKRKLGRLKPYMHDTLWRRIVKITPIGRHASTCIKVDAVDGLFVTRDFVVTHNTTVMMDMALRIAHDMDWHGVPMKMGWGAIVLAGEDAEGSKDQVRAWMRMHEVESLSDRFVFMDTIVNLMDPSSIEKWGTHLKKVSGGRRFVVFGDTWQIATAFGAQNEDESMQIAIMHVKRLAKAVNGPAVMAAHPPKGNETTWSGSAVMENHSQALWLLTKENYGMKFSVPRIKGTAADHYSLFTFEKQDLGGRDEWGFPNIGIVPVKIGGEGHTASESDTDRVNSIRKAYAATIFELMNEAEETEPDFAKNRGAAFSIAATARRLVQASEQGKTKRIDMLGESLKAERSNRRRLEELFRETKEPVVVGRMKGDNLCMHLYSPPGKQSYSFRVSAVSAPAMAPDAPEERLEPEEDFPI